MSSKTDQLNNLFTIWEKKHESYRSGFKRDGIVDEYLFTKTKTKILYITKEPNDPKQSAGDYREWWKEGVKYSFSHRIAEWSYGLLNNFPQYDDIRKNNKLINESILKIAFMNIKKSGGTGSSNYDIIMEHLEMNKEYIKEEIQIIDPDIIITGITWKETRKALFPNVVWKNSGYAVAIGRYNNAKVIDFYHPSSRTAPSASYSLLQNIVNSHNFKTL